MGTLEYKTATPEILNSDGATDKLRDWVLNFTKIEKMTNDSAILDMPLHPCAINVPTWLRSYA
jgi:hypothetical protein